MSSTPDDITLGRLLYEIARIWRARIDSSLHMYGLSRAKWHVLLALEEAGNSGLLQRDLARACSVEPPSIAYLLERMEQEGWVVRSTDKTDRRSKRTRATDKARTIREEIMAVSRQVESEVFANLTPETYRQIQQNLLQLRDALEKTHPPATDDHQGLKLS